MPTAMISPSDRVPGRASEPPEMGSAMAAATELFVDGGSGLQGFPEIMNKLAEGRGRWRPGWPTPPLGAGQGQAAPRSGEAALLPPFDSPLDSVFVTVKY